MSDVIYLINPNIVCATFWFNLGIFVILKVILDVTFYEENKLVDQEFPEDCSPFKIQQLLQDLTEPEVLAGRLAPGQEVCTCIYAEGGRNHKTQRCVVLK